MLQSPINLITINHSYEICCHELLAAVVASCERALLSIHAFVLVVKYGKLGLDRVQHQLVHLVHLFEVLLYAILSFDGVLLLFCACSCPLLRRSLAFPLEGVLFYLVGLRVDEIKLLEVAQLLVFEELSNFAGVAHLGLASHALVSDLVEVVAGTGPAQCSWAVYLL